MKICPPGTRIGPYEIVSHPLRGGMGVVYFCLDHGHDERPVALKTFQPEYLPDRAARDRFLREGTAWVDLGAHPHVVRCYGVERIGDDTEVYLVLELIAKEQGYPDASLRSWLLPGHPLPVEWTSKSPRCWASWRRGRRLPPSSANSWRAAPPTKPRCWP